MYQIPESRVRTRVRSAQFARVLLVPPAALTHRESAAVYLMNGRSDKISILIIKCGTKLERGKERVSWLLRDDSLSIPVKAYSLYFQ